MRKGRLAAPLSFSPSTPSTLSKHGTGIHRRSASSIHASVKFGTRWFDAGRAKRDVRGSSHPLRRTAPRAPGGFRYQPALSTRPRSGGCSTRCGARLQAVRIPWFLGKRETVSFGWRYDFNGGGLSKTNDMPEFLLPLRAAASAFAGLEPAQLQQALLTKYPPGATIGWHKDRSVFGEVIGFSLLSPCTFRFRRRPARNGSARRSSPSRARRICCSALRARSGSTASRGRGAPLLDHVPEFEGVTNRGARPWYGRDLPRAAARCRAPEIPVARPAVAAASARQAVARSAACRSDRRHEISVRRA